ncbi:DUF4432 family protein [Paenibacillus sp. HWE-109]|uniref:DUF4432 family protein n=1 Tax=Paenibacillus sp. HWE-109 TaxID=1306526 RepID=UPI001EDCEC31|nr:DUF4432 family protein [Paenibacillus sp. HWE-109]UKS28038.1 DUF4432 family protein [Paenibacillus sp. HWE-109]
MDASWRTSTYKGYLSIIGENSHIRTEIVPERGSKLVSIIYKQTGREWIYSTDISWSKPLHYGMAWEEADRSGWDELFPTILPCLCPDDFYKGRELPDHGELWSLPWDYAIGGSTAELWVKGVQIPYDFKKTYRLEGPELHIHYELHNPTCHAFSYIWAPHCLVKIEEGMKLSMGNPHSNILMLHSRMERFEPDGRVDSYPLIKLSGGKSIDLSVVEPKLNLHAEKYWFVDRQIRGEFEIKTPHTQESLVMIYSPESLPYLAVWTNYGGYWGDYNLAIEPSTSYLDDVESSFHTGKVKTINGNGTESWNLKVLLKQGGVHQ